MTLKELYAAIDGNYDQAISVLRVEKLIDKHIRKFPQGGVTEALLEAGKDMDPTRLFETSHAMKGVCANLGLMKLSAAASEISEEFRPGNPRRMTDGQVADKLREIEELYRKTAEGIRQYAESVE